MKQIKKVARIVGIGIIALVILFFAADTGLRWWYQHKDKIDECVQTEFSQYLCGVVRTIEICEQNEIKIDNDFKEKIREYVTKLLKCHMESMVELEDIIKLIYLNHYYDLGYEKGLNQALGRHYAEEEKIFTVYEYGTYTKEGWKNNIKNSRSITIENLQLLNLSGTYIKDYQIEEGLAEWFNSNVDKFAEGKDKEFIEEYENDLCAILWYFMEEGKLECIDYEKMKNPLLKTVKEYKKELKQLEKSTEIDWNAPLMARYISDYKEIYEQDSLWREVNVELYNKMNSEKDFWYMVTDDTYFWVIESFLDNVGDISGNKFFVEHINQWLWENMEKSTEQILINGTDFK